MSFSPFPITEIYIFMYIFAKWDNCQLLLSAEEGKQAEEFNCVAYVLVQVNSFYDGSRFKITLITIFILSINAIVLLKYCYWDCHIFKRLIIKQRPKTDLVEENHFLMQHQTKAIALSSTAVVLHHMVILMVLSIILPLCHHSWNQLLFHQITNNSNSEHLCLFNRLQHRTTCHYRSHQHHRHQLVNLALTGVNRHFIEF